MQFLEVRETIPLCGSADYGHADEVLSRTISLISDCEALLQNWQQAARRIKDKRIKLIETPYFIDEALKNISISEYSGFGSSESP